MIYLKDSAAQDEKVMDYQKQHRAGLVDIYKEQQIQSKLQQMEKALGPIKVINPFAPLIDLPDGFPKKRKRYNRGLTGGLSNKEVRSWSSDQVKKIDISLDLTEASARKVGYNVIRLNSKLEI